MQADRIVGAHDPLVRRVRQIITNRIPNPRRLFVLEGLSGHRQALEARIAIEQFFYCPDYMWGNEASLLVEQVQNRAARSFRVSARAFERMSERDRPIGLLSVCRMPTWTLDDLARSGANTVVVVDGLEIPGNLGTVIRTADCFGAAGLILCNRRARLTHPKVLRASQGMCFRVPTVEATVADARSWLRGHGFAVVLADATGGRPCFECRFQNKVAVVLGNERRGLSREWFDGEAVRVTVPMFGNADSLNVAIAGSIILYHIAVETAGTRRREFTRTPN